MNKLRCWRVERRGAPRAPLGAGTAPSRVGLHRNKLNAFRNIYVYIFKYLDRMLKPLGQGPGRAACMRVTRRPGGTRSHQVLFGCPVFLVARLDETFCHAIAFVGQAALLGRPILAPRTRAAAIPARVRSLIRERSNSASAAIR